MAEAKINIPTTLASSHSSIDTMSNCVNGKQIKSLPERIPAFGLLMAILSVFCFSIASVIVRILITLPTLEILVWRYVDYFFC